MTREIISSFMNKNDPIIVLNTIQYSEFNKALQGALGAKIKKLSFERVHVLSVECTDHHIEFPLSVDIQDHFGVSLNTQTCLKEQKQGNASNIVSLSGPVIFQNNIVPKTLYECNEPLSNSFWRSHY